MVRLIPAPHSNEPCYGNREEMRSMNPQMQNFLLTIELPGIVFPLLIALVAILGIARWHRTLLVLALVALVLRILGILFLRMLYLGVESALPGSVIEFLQALGIPTVTVSFSVTTVGAFLALVLAARERAWAWFVVILLAAIISILAGNFALSPYGLIVLVGSARAMQIYTDLLYVVITNVIAGLTILAQLLYALIGPRTTAATASPLATPDDVTLP